MIRLGTLAGYAFEGPRVLAGWTAPPTPGVFAIAYKPDATKPDRHAIIYVDHADDLSEAKIGFRHPRAQCWISRAGDRYGLYVCTFDAPGTTRAHREQIVAELCAVYRPSCNDQQFDAAWKDEWIGSYNAPTTGPLTTDREP